MTKLAGCLKGCDCWLACGGGKKAEGGGGLTDPKVFDDFINPIGWCALLVLAKVFE